MNEQKLLTQLRDYYARHRDLPSVSAMTLMCGESDAIVSEALSKLVSEAFLRKEKGTQSAYEPAEHFFEAGMAADTIPAGQPREFAASAQETVNLHAFLIKRPSQTVTIKVQGDSMEKAGILDGDLAIVEMGRAALPNDIVVAKVDGAYTLKRLIRTEAGFALRAENPKYPDIIPAGELEVHGILVGVARRLH